VLLAVGEEVVDEHADNREEEDKQAPEDLVWYRAVGLENLDCCEFVSMTERLRWVRWMG
jgi:hypothetical protein